MFWLKACKYEIIGKYIELAGLIITKTLVYI